MGSRLVLQRFKNRQHVISEVKRCALAGSVFQYFGFLFVTIGVISDALKITLGLNTISWFLLAIFAGLQAVVPHMHLVVAKHLLGIETE